MRAHMIFGNPLALAGPCLTGESPCYRAAGAAIFAGSSPNS